MDHAKSPPQPVKQDESTIPLAQRKTMTTLLPTDCRWPIGDPQLDGFHFCGKPKQDGHPPTVIARQGGKPAGTVAADCIPSA